MNLLLFFIILNILNVIIQTFKSIATIKCGKVGASLVNAIAYGLYTVVLVYTNCELSLLAKVLVVAGSNLVGVYIVKWLEEKTEKQKLWKVELTVLNREHFIIIKNILKSLEIPFSYQDLQKIQILNIYCYTKQQSFYINDIVKNYDVKYFASEGKTL